MRKPKPCEWCGGPKPRGKGIRVCGECRLVDTIWARMVLGPGDCWLWTGSVFKGYGQVGNDQPHRMAYQELIGEIPLGLQLDHLCRVPTCCNPWHLDPVTQAENNRRKWALYLRCKNGHEFTETNIHRSAGRRRCRECARGWSSDYRRRKVVTG